MPVEEPKTAQQELTTCDLAATPPEMLGSALHRLKIALSLDPEIKRASDAVKGMNRNNAASLARLREIALHQLRPLLEQMDKFTVPEFRLFAHNMENGLPQQNPEYDAIARQLRAALNDRREMLQSIGKLDEYNEFYFPHLWEDYAKSRRNFLRERKYVSIEDGLDAGLTPISYNPVRLVLAHLEQVDRFVTEERSFKEAVGFKYVEWLKAGKPLREGWRHLRSNRFNPKVNALDKGHFKEYGSYVAPKPVADIFDNMSKPGLRGHMLYDVVHNYGMRANMAQLGLSLYHATFNAVAATADQMALGLEQAINEGKFGEGLTNIVTSPAAVVRYLVKGNAMMQAYLDPARLGKLQNLVDAMELGGGRAYMDTFYRTNSLDHFRQGWKDFQQDHSFLKPLKGARAAWRGLDLAFNKLNAPILEYMVPRIKLAAFANAAQDALGRMDETVGLDARRKIFGDIWDRVDNRFGELVYDNLFWSKTAKDLGMISVRSLGWNIGTVREFGGAAADWAKFIGGKDKFTNRMGFTLALPIVTGIFNGIYTKLATGQMPHGMDYLAARDGKLNPDGTPHRMWIASYVKDVANFVTAARHDWLERPSIKNVSAMVGNKLNPALEQLYNLKTNEDYYGREIFPGGQSAGQTLKDFGSYMLRANMPISIQNAQAAREGGSSFGEQLQGFIGITPAPRHLADTPTEQIIDDAMTHSGPMSQLSYNNMRLKSKLRDQFRLGKVTSADLDAALENPAIGAAGIERIRNEAKENPLVYNFKRIPFQDAVRAFRLANSREHKLLLPAMAQRMHEIQRMPTEQQDYYLNILDKLLTDRK